MKAGSDASIKPRAHLVLHFQLGLNFVAAQLPGGVRTAIHLAWLSGVPEVRAVAERWNALSAPEKRNAILEDLCDGVGVSHQEFIVEVTVTGFELGMDVSGIFWGVEHMVDALMRVHQKTMKGNVRAMQQWFESVRLHTPPWVIRWTCRLKLVEPT
jgi:hypothetical protein